MGQAGQGQQFPAPGDAPVGSAEEVIAVALIDKVLGLAVGHGPFGQIGPAGPDKPGQTVLDQVGLNGCETWDRPLTSRVVFPVLAGTGARHFGPESIEASVLAGPRVEGVHFVAARRRLGQSSLVSGLNRDYILHPFLSSCEM
jgi:hypothetical protein